MKIIYSLILWNYDYASYKFNVNLIYRLVMDQNEYIISVLENIQKNANKPKAPRNTLYEKLEEFPH